MLHEVKGNTVAMLWESALEPYSMTEGHWNSEDLRRRAEGFITGRSGDQSESWLGAPDVATLNRRLKDGWPEGSDRLLQLATREINPKSIRRRRERADQGSELDIHAVYRGDLSRAWSRTRRRSGNGVRNLAILCNLGADCGVNADRLFWRGASALKLATALTESGYNVSIYGFEAGQKTCVAGKTKVVQFVEIKAEDQPMDLDRLAALTAMPGYFRTALFGGIMKACDLVNVVAAGGLGTPLHDGIDEIAAMLPVIPDNAIIQPPVKDKATSEAWIDEVLLGLDPESAED